MLLAGLLLAVPVQQATAQAAVTATPTPSAAATANPYVTASDMKVTPSTYTGSCKVGPYGLEHIVSATITVSKPMTVNYSWMADYGFWTAGSVTFDAPGSKTVSNVFFRTTSLRGTMRLRIVEPAGVADTQAASFDTVCVKPTVSDISKQRTDENEVCGPGAPAELTLTAKLAVADGPSTVDYRWYRKSNQTRNQWVYLGAGSAVFTSTGAQEKTITTRYSTSVSENGYFKVELSSPYQGLGQSAFLVSCSTKNDL
ncbi:hypothetical protein Misp03_52170 [Microbispora sp. NBRC 16548]|nr:hypothetical protein Misp03_52170 [Microbispora sp. NBRC 16548]